MREAREVPDLQSDVLLDYTPNPEVFLSQVSVHIRDSAMAVAVDGGPRPLHPAEQQGRRLADADVQPAAQEGGAHRLPPHGEGPPQHGRPRRAHLPAGRRPHRGLLRVRKWIVDVNIYHQIS